MCGSYQTAHEWHKDWARYAQTRRQQICAEFTFLDAYKAVLSGSDLDNEIPQYPDVQEAVSWANRKYHADVDEAELLLATRRIWKGFSERANLIIVTGAWADPKDGCAWTVYQELRRMSKRRLAVRLSSLAARHDVPDEEIEAGVEAEDEGDVGALRRIGRRVRWALVVQGLGAAIVGGVVAYGMNKMGWFGGPQSGLYLLPWLAILGGLWRGAAGLVSR